MLWCLKCTGTVYVSVLRWSWLFLQTGTSHTMPTLFSSYWLSINYIAKGHYILDTWHTPLTDFSLSVLEAGTKTICSLTLFPAYHREVARAICFPSPQQVLWAIHKCPKWNASPERPYTCHSSVPCPLMSELEVRHLCNTVNISTLSGDAHMPPYVGGAICNTGVDPDSRTVLMACWQGE